MPSDSASAPTNRFGLARSARPGVVEIVTGMNYWDGEKYSPSDASFVLTEDAFVANRVQHRTRLNADLNIIGAVTTTLHDGTTLRSTPVAIALYDPNDGRFTVISTLTNSVGVLVASNRVVFPDAFSGGVCANVVYTLQKGSFEQDVVITGRLNPLDYGFPTNSQIQILTEFYDPPQPEKLRRPIYVEQKEAVRRRKVSPDMMDEVLGFGELVIGTGRAFTPPTATHTNGTQTVVAKEFRTIPQEGRTFLIETINCLSVQKALNSLPECAGGKRTAQEIRSSKARDGYAFIPRPAQTAQAKTKPQRSSTLIAKATRENPRGVVIDYIATVGGGYGTMVFKADATYFVSGPAYYWGAVTIEGGAVFKYPNSTGTDQQGHATTAYIQLNNTVTCKTSSYRPAIFTAGDDDGIGDILTTQQWPGHTGNIGTKYYANPAIYSYWLSAPTLSNVRFCYAQEAVRLEGSYVSGTLSHAQFVNCVRGIVLMNAEDSSGSGEGSGGGGIYLTVNNALLAFVTTAFSASDYGSGSGSGIGGGATFNNCTVDNSQVLLSATQFSSASFKNCIFANVTSLGYPVP
jgi:hypothetical protein